MSDRTPTLPGGIPGRVGEQVPARLLLGARNLLFRAKCRWYAVRNAFATDGHGLSSEVVWVDPGEVEHVTRHRDGLDFGPDQLGVGAFDKFRRTGAVAGGDWDRDTIRFSQLPIYRGLAERIREGRAWEETTYFEVYTDRIQRGDEPWGCTSTSDLQERCGHVERLWRRIDREGYRSQRDLGKYPVDEVNVNVGRGGELLFNDGRHRLAAAKLLGIDELPVRILVVHEEFDGDVSPE